MNAVLKIYKVIIAGMLVFSVLLASAYGFYLYFPVGKNEVGSVKWLDEDKTQLEYNSKKYIKVQTADRAYLNSSEDDDNYAYFDAFYVVPPSIGLNGRFKTFIPVFKENTDFKKIYTSARKTYCTVYEDRQKVGMYEGGGIIACTAEYDYFFQPYDMNYYFEESLFFKNEPTADDIEKISVCSGYYCGDFLADDSEPSQKIERMFDLIGGRILSNETCVKTLESKKDITAFYNMLDDQTKIIDYYDKLWINYKTKKLYFKVDIKDCPFSLYCFPANIIRRDPSGVKDFAVQSYSLPDSSVPECYDTDIIGIISCERAGVKPASDDYSYSMKLKIKNYSSLNFRANDKLAVKVWLEGEDKVWRDGEYLDYFYIVSDYTENKLFCKAHDTIEITVTLVVDEEEKETLDFLFENNSHPDFMIGDKYEIEYLDEAG